MYGKGGNSIMPIRSGIEAASEIAPAKCLARSVVDALAETPSLEAVTIDRARQTISLATLGRADVPRLEQQISSTIQRAQEAGSAQGCTLLAGDGDCLSCDRPLSELERGKITIRHDAETTTI